MQAALCSAYVRIAKSCPVHIWRPESLINILSFPRPIFNLIDCFRVAICWLAPHLVGEGMPKDCSTDLSTSGDSGCDSSRMKGKRSASNLESSYVKRQKIGGEKKDFNTSCQAKSACIDKVACVGEKEYAYRVFNSLSTLVEDLIPPVENVKSLSPEISLTALSTLIIAFCEYRHLNLSLGLSRQLLSWIQWISEQVD